MNEDRATRYNRLRRRVSAAAVAWSLTFLIVLLITGASAVLRDLATGAAGYVPAGWFRPVSVTLFVAALAVLHEIVRLPFDFYGFVLERRYGLSRQQLSGWLADAVKALAVVVVLGAAAANILYYFIDRYPSGWWLPASATFAALIVGLSTAAPLVLLPLFYTVKPLTKDSLRARLVALGEKAGARVLDAYEWGLAEKTSKANAALTGLGGSRRILVSDTMLAEYSDDEIEVVLAHEIAHHVHGDIWTGLAVETALIVTGFFCASWLLAVGAPLAGLRGVSDIAGLPLLILAAGIVSLATMPAAHALSRAHERRADRFALTLTQNPPAFISAMRRLAAQNLAEDDPSMLARWLFHSHPPIRERIAAAQTFKP